MARRRRAPRNARTTAENGSTFAVRDTAKGSKNRTNTGSVKGSFKAASKAVTLPGNDKPKPQARKRRGGDSDSRMLRFALDLKRREIRALGYKRRGKSAARGRYERLPSPRQEDKDEFFLAARAMCNVAEAIADMLTDFREQLHAALYSHTVDLGMETPSEQFGSFNLSLCNPFGGFENEGVDHGGFDAPDTGANRISLGL